MAKHEQIRDIKIFAYYFPLICIFYSQKLFSIQRNFFKYHFKIEWELQLPAPDVAIHQIYRYVILSYGIAYHLKITYFSPSM